MRTFVGTGRCRRTGTGFEIDRQSGARVALRSRDGTSGSRTCPTATTPSRCSDVCALSVSTPSSIATVCRSPVSAPDGRTLAIGRRVVARWTGRHDLPLRDGAGRRSAPVAPITIDGHPPLPSSPVRSAARRARDSSASSSMPSERSGHLPVTIHGPPTTGSVSIRGDVSSQYVTRADADRSVPARADSRWI